MRLCKMEFPPILVLFLLEAPFRSTLVLYRPLAPAPPGSTFASQCGHSTMFRRALRLGSRVSVASAAAVIPATAAACLSDSKPGVEINDFGAVPREYRPVLVDAPPPPGRPRVPRGQRVHVQIQAERRAQAPPVAQRLRCAGRRRRARGRLGAGARQGGRPRGERRGRGRELGIPVVYIEQY